MIPLYDDVPSERPPIVNTLLIALNVAVFALELAAGRHLADLIRTWGLVPLAVVQAERDQYGSPAEVEAALAGAAAPRRLAVVPGATHLFTEDLAGLEREALAALEWLRAAAP